MDHKTLKLLRISAPALFWSIPAIPLTEYLPSIKALGKIDTPIVKGGSFVALATLLYLMIRLREISNRWYFKRVNQNLTSKLWIYARPGEARPREWNWPKARHVFYPIVDNDASLKIKSENVYSNGLLWTSAADLRAVSIISWVILILFAYFSGLRPGIFPWLMGLPAVALLSVILSEIVTDTQMELGNEQLEYIGLHHREKLAELVEKSISKS